MLSRRIHTYSCLQGLGNMPARSTNPRRMLEVSGSTGPTRVCSITTDRIQNTSTRTVMENPSVAKSTMERGMVPADCWNTQYRAYNSSIAAIAMDCTAVYVVQRSANVEACAWDRASASSSLLSSGRANLQLMGIYRHCVCASTSKLNGFWLLKVVPGLFGVPRWQHRKK